jgi:hypothetical protein
MYLLAFLDRVNIANANVFGLSTELGIADANSTKYNTALVIFFGKGYTTSDLILTILTICSPLYSFRDTLQHPSQEAEAESVAVDLHVRLRFRHYHAGSRAELLRSSGYAFLPRSL